jgi:multiple sugar transport system substrate-binding protein
MTNPRVTRRTVLKAGAGLTAFAATTNILTPRRSDAARDHKLVFWLQPNFNPVADKVLEEQTMAFARQAGLKDSEVQIQKVPGGELAAKLAGALEVGAPPDVTRLEEPLVARYKGQRHLLDVTDVLAEMRARPGGVAASVLPLTEEGGRSYAVPMGLNAMIFHARTDLLEKAGYSTFPETWERFIEASLKIQQPPFYAYGMALGTTQGYSDSTGDILIQMWSQGGKLLDRNGRPAVSSPGTVKAFELIRDMYSKHQIIPKGALTWDNSGNNKAYQSKQVAFVYDGTSIYSYLLSQDKDLADRTGLFPAPAGAAGRFKHLYPAYYGAFKATPYPDLARGLIKHFLEPKNYHEFIVGTQGRYLPVYPKLLEDPFWGSKPPLVNLVAAGREGLPLAWEGRMTPALGEVVAQSLLGKTAHTILVDKVEPAEAVARLHTEVVAIYKRLGEPA